MKRGQTTSEYMLIVGVAAAGLIAMLVYVSRGHQGRLRSEADKLAVMQYEPGNTNVNNRQEKELTSTSISGSTTTTIHPENDTDQENEALVGTDEEIGILGEIQQCWDTIYFNMGEWESQLETEAFAGMAAYRAGTFDWSSTLLSGIIDLINEQDDLLNGVEIELPPDITPDDPLEIPGLYDQAEDAAAAFPERDPDQTTTTSYSEESGRIKSTTWTNETLGGL